MVTRSDINYDKHKDDIYKMLSERYGDKKAKEFIDFYGERYDKFNRSFLDYKVAWLLYDDYKLVCKSGVRWYACVGDGGTGKTTLGKNINGFLDTCFTGRQIQTTGLGIVKTLSTFPLVDARRSLLFDEPDETIHSNSREGKLLRSILGKARQQALFMTYCATTLTDIPPYIYKKISGIFFTPKLGEAMFFKNRSRYKDYVVQEIKEGYAKFGYAIFYKLQKRKGCLLFKTRRGTPLNPIEEEVYLSEKAKDYAETQKKFLKMYVGDKKKPEISERDKIILKLKEKKLSYNEIGELVGLKKTRIGEILQNLTVSGIR